LFVSNKVLYIGDACIIGANCCYYTRGGACVDTRGSSFIDHGVNCCIFGVEIMLACDIKTRSRCCYRSQQSRLSWLLRGTYEQTTKSNIYSSMISSLGLLQVGWKLVPPPEICSALCSFYFCRLLDFAPISPLNYHCSPTNLRALH
jgi:hypothetical protein